MARVRCSRNVRPDQPARLGRLSYRAKKTLRLLASLANMDLNVIGAGDAGPQSEGTRGGRRTAAGGESADPARPVAGARRAAGGGGAAARRRTGRTGIRPPLVGVVGALAHPRLSGPGGRTRLPRPWTGRAAGQPGRVRVPDYGPGARARGRAVQFVLRHLLRARLPAAAGTHLLVHQQLGHRVPRGHRGQLGDQRPAHAAGLPGATPPAPAPLDRVQRGGGRGPGARGGLLHPVRNVGRGVPGRGAGLAAARA